MKTKFPRYLLCGIFIVSSFTYANAQTKKSQSIDAKISSVIKKLTFEEKISLLHANGIFSAGGIKRLGIPEIMTDDGPLGVREDVKEGWGSANLTTDSATFFPNGSALAATWNPDLAYRYGHDMGEEARARNKTVMLAPASGFYGTTGLGKDEVRLAYVLNVDAINAAMDCLEKALEEYPGRKNI